MISKTFLFTTVVAVMSRLYAQAPQPRFDHISIEQGLSESIVLAIAQDAQGYMWFGTADGLNRFDGYDFRVFKNISPDSTSLSANYVQALYRDSRGNLWVGTLGGLDLYDEEHELFIHYNFDMNTPQGKNAFTVNAMYESKSGDFWVGGMGAGLTKFLFDYSEFPPKTKAIQQFRDQKGSHLGLSGDNVTSFVEDSSGAIWVATWGGGLNRLDPSTNTFIHFVHSEENPGSICHNFLRALVLDARQNLWIASEGNGLDRLNLREFDVQLPERTHFMHYPYTYGETRDVSHHSIRSLLWESRQGRLWVGTDGGGLNLYQPIDDSFVAYTHDKYDSKTIANDRVVSIFEDNASTLWFGTWGSGVSRHSPSREKFRQSEETQFITEHLTSKFLLAIHQDRNNNLWFGTHSAGLNKYDRTTKQIIHFKHDPNDGRSLSSDVVWSISEDQNGFIWLATDRGVNKFEPARERFVHYLHNPNDPKSLPDNFVTRVHADADSNVWVATSTGLSKIDMRTSAVTRYDHYSITKDSTSPGGMSALYEDSKGLLWVGLGGFLCFDRKQEKFIWLQPTMNVPDKENLNLASSIFVARNGVVWMGTYGYGLHGFNPGDGSIVQFTENNGLPNNAVYGVLEDAHGNLWMSTNKGIARLNPSTQSFTHYDVKDGLQSNEFNRGAYFQAADGVMYFGGINGFNAFHPDSIRNNLYAPPVVITAFKKFNKPVRFGKVVSLIDEIVLQHDDNFFSFEFAGLDFVDPENNVYAYMLEGVDVNWVECGARRFASYTNIDPGEYVFRVKASNSDGVWNEKGASIKVRIIPPFWRTSWFMVLAALAVTGTFGVTVRFASTRKLRKQVEELERERAIHDERERISRDLHDHVGAQLVNIISGLDLVGKYSPPTETRAQRLLKSLQQDARASIMLLRETIWTIKTQAMTLEKFVAQVELYSRKQMESYGEAELIFESGCGTAVELSPTQVLNSFRIIQEALTNCMKHANAEHIWVQVHSTPGPGVRIVVKDDGVGSRKEMNPELGGNGILNMRRRAEEIGSQFSIQSEGETGTEVCLHIPLTNQKR